MTNSTRFETTKGRVFGAEVANALRTMETADFLESRIHGPVIQNYQQEGYRIEGSLTYTAHDRYEHHAEEQFRTPS